MDIMRWCVPCEAGAITGCFQTIEIRTRMFLRDAADWLWPQYVEMKDKGTSPMRDVVDTSAEPFSPAGDEFVVIEDCS